MDEPLSFDRRVDNRIAPRQEAATGNCYAWSLFPRYLGYWSSNKQQTGWGARHISSHEEKPPTPDDATERTTGPVAIGASRRPSHFGGQSQA